MFLHKRTDFKTIYLTFQKIAKNIFGTIENKAKRVLP